MHIPHKKRTIIANYNLLLCADSTTFQKKLLIHLPYTLRPVSPSRTTLLSRNLTTDKDVQRAQNNVCPCARCCIITRPCGPLVKTDLYFNHSLFYLIQFLKILDALFFCLYFLYFSSLLSLPQIQVVIHEHVQVYRYFRLLNNDKLFDINLLNKHNDFNIFLYRYGVASSERIHVPKGCHPVADGCQIALISDIDNVTDCYSIGPHAAARRRDEMMRGMARQIAHREYPQAMQYWHGLNPPPISPLAVLFGGAGRRGPNGRVAEQPEGLMESFLLMSMFGGGAGGGMGLGAQPHSAGGAGDPIGHMGGGGQNMDGMNMGMGGGLGGSLFGSPLGMGLLFSSFMS